MAGFGENMRREREMRGITLDEISNTTKISVRMLEALENENFSKLPGGIFTRSFIRAYANYLGLDEERVMSEYQIAAPSNGEQDLSRFGASSNQSRSKPGVPVLTWTIAVLLLAGGYGIFRYGHRSTEVPVSFGNPSTISSAPHAAAVAPSLPAGSPPQVLAPDTTSAPSSSSAISTTPNQVATAQSGVGSTLAPAKMGNTKNPATQTESPAPATAQVTDGQRKAASDVPVESVDQPLSSGAASTSSAQPAAASVASVATEAAGSLVLQVAATQRAWVAVDADGKNVFERVLNPAEQHTLMAKNYFDVTTGNAQGTVLTLNGVTLKPLGRHGEVKTLHLTRDDLRNATP